MDQTLPLSVRGTVCETNTHAHTQVNTNVQQAGASEFYLTLEEVESINHVVVFLTGQVPFSDGFGGSIYFGWPVGKLTTHTHSLYSNSNLMSNKLIPP